LRAALIFVKNAKISNFIKGSYLSLAIVYWSQKPAGLDTYFTPFLIPYPVPNRVRNGKEERGG
jgi:hypothetical protein